MRNYKDNVVVKLTFQFALDIMEFSEILRDQKRFAFADQVLRAGCSIGANVKEAQNAESKADFIHKLKISAKEAEETEYWLELCEFAKNYPKPGKLLNDIESILKVLSKIISTSKKNKQSTNRKIDH
jgi:four helix bundle protein